MSDVSHPFEETDAGNYRVIEPLDGAEPESLCVTLHGTTYRLHGYLGRDIRSKVRAAVLVYENLEVVGDDE